MASRKNLKKTIKNLCGELMADCVVLNMCKDANHEAIEKIMNDVAAIYSDYVARISHTEKGSEKLFYKKFRSEFTEKFNALAEAIIKA